MLCNTRVSSLPNNINHKNNLYKHLLDVPQQISMMFVHLNFSGQPQLFSGEIHTNLCSSVSS